MTDSTPSAAIRHTDLTREDSDRIATLFYSHREDLRAYSGAGIALAHLARSAFFSGNEYQLEALLVGAQACAAAVHRVIALALGENEPEEQPSESHELETYALELTRKAKEGHHEH